MKLSREERDRRREDTERHFARLRSEHRDRHVAIVEAALTDRFTGFGQRAVAEAAVEALLDAGVVFAALGAVDGETS